MFKSHNKGGKLVKLEKKVKKMEIRDRPELKHVYIDQVLTPPTSVEVFPSTSVQHCVIVAQGPNGNQRIGNKIRGKYLNFNYHLVNFNNAVQINHMACRVMLVLDKRSNQQDIGFTAGALGDLFQISGINGQYMDPNNMYNQEYRKRFTILYDKVHEVGGLKATDPNMSSFVQRRVRIPCNHKMVFDTNNPSGASSNITEGTIWLIYKPQQTENIGALVAAPQLHWFLDYFFTDA